MKSPVVFLSLLTLLAFDLLTCTHASLPKWGNLIAGPPPPAPLRAPFTVLPPTELSSSIPAVEFTQEHDVFAAASAGPSSAAEPSESPEPVAPVAAMEHSETPEVSAVPVLPVSATSASSEHAPLESPQISVYPVLSTTASPVSVPALLDAISTSFPSDGHEKQPAETELSFVTPAAIKESLPVSLPHLETTMHMRDIHKRRACFPSHALVTLRGGTKIPIARLRVGDLMESEPGIFSPVLLHTHADTQANTMFLVLRTRQGSQIAASPGHYLLTGDGRFRFAGHFHVHDQVRTASGLDYVASVRRAIYRGLHNPQTASGKLLVAVGSDAPAVQASTYTTAVLPSAAHAALTPLRALHYTLGITFPALSACIHSVAESPLLRPFYNSDDSNRVAYAFPSSIRIGINVGLSFYIRLLRLS